MAIAGFVLSLLTLLVISLACPWAGIACGVACIVIAMLRAESKLSLATIMISVLAVGLSSWFLCLDFTIWTLL